MARRKRPSRRDPHAVLQREQKKMEQQDRIAHQESLRKDLAIALRNLRTSHPQVNVDEMTIKAQVTTLVGLLSESGLIDRVAYNVSLYENLLGKVSKTTETEAEEKKVEVSQ